MFNINVNLEFNIKKIKFLRRNHEIFPGSKIPTCLSRTKQRNAKKLTKANEEKLSESRNDQLVVANYVGKVNSCFTRQTTNMKISIELIPRIKSNRELELIIKQKCFVNMI